jgi:tripeptidyl-peptidase-1
MYRRQSSALDRRSTDKAPKVSPYDTSTCGKWITPACLKALYGIPNATVNQPENALGVFADDDIYDQEDLDLYFSHYAPWVPNGTHPNLQSINGAKAPVPTIERGVESTLDFDLSFALLYPQEVTLYQTQSTQTQQKMSIKEYGPAANESVAEVFLPFIAALDGQLCTQREKESGADCGTIELTNVLSVSYGYSELQTPERAAERICAEFMKLALKGHTLLLASQDEGVGQKPPFASIPGVPWTNGCKSPYFASRRM